MSIPGNYMHLNSEKYSSNLVWLVHTFALRDTAFRCHYELFSLCSPSPIRLDHVGESNRIGIMFLLSSLACTRSVDFSNQVHESSFFDCDSDITSYRAANSNR